MFPRALVRLLALTVAGGCPGLSLALSADTQQPVHIAADSATLNDQTGVGVYRGNVRITQGSMELNADRVELIAPAHVLKKVIAEGNPGTFRQRTEDNQALNAQAQYMEYDLEANTLLLKGSAKLHEGVNTFASERIEYHLTREVLNAGGPQTPGRVEMTLMPERAKNRPPEGR